ncbi:hypothetical protein KFK09_002853 [Dendrobium nobile]|uniref:Uncharacterized protein n=1 Tax=Dendrobium nobile TaxID=94219 RepID=A0A8T3C2U0_DENNO|nr:hypothetical protein KFK09_002853 [Dendrobium nobile]
MVTVSTIVERNSMMNFLDLLFSMINTNLRNNLMIEAKQRMHANADSGKFAPQLIVYKYSFYCHENPDLGFI